jgi:hypothetical protein
MPDISLVSAERLLELWGTWQPPEESPDIVPRADDLESLSSYIAHFAALNAGAADEQTTSKAPFP